MYTTHIICIHLTKNVYEQHNNDMYIHTSGAFGSSDRVHSLVDQLKSVGLRLQDRSLLHTADDIIESKGSLAGEFKLQLKRTRRNSAVVQLDDTIFRKIAATCRSMNIAVPAERTAVRAVKGIKMNGRPVSAGDMCVCASHVSQARAFRGDQSVRSACKVVAFYQVDCGDDAHVFAEVVLQDTASRHRMLFILDLNQSDAVVPSEGSATIIMHVDDVIAKLHVAPHYAGSPDLVCAIPMWDTR